MKICKIHNCEKECRERFVKGVFRREWICLDCESLRGKNYYLNNKEDRLNYQNSYYADNKLDILHNKIIYYEDNKKDILLYKKEYYYENKPLIRQSQNKYKKARRIKDPVFKLRENISRQISFALNGNKNNLSILKYLPYTMQELKEHLEKQFDQHMCWDNYGSYWHIDHIYPQSKLPYTSMEDFAFQLCWSLDNLQPLEANENIRKSNRVKING